ncbi:hypothetical protein AAL_08004 [Moelleriella libera RCEF 2490]|uniref:Uncharacterized protein n=1 Tax=Moelleriella libera RCEF 2490 TaxID=1081109 RepID=A0A162I5A2_9HYPO|nr:hypothetical protein AAL_08004 [Moelleriella libera RCEF 2490]
MSASAKFDTLQRVVNGLDIGDVFALKEVFTYSQMLNQCYHSRVNPIQYLSQTFNHPLTLLSVMFDTGCIIGGPRALEFFFPASADADEWTFFVPGFKESVLDMANALHLCGVSWQTNADEILALLRRRQTATASRTVLDCLVSWIEDCGQSAAEHLVGKDLYQVLEAYQAIDINERDRANSFLIADVGSWTISVVPIPAENQGRSPAGSGKEIMTGLTGRIQTGRGPQSVRLMVGSSADGTESCMSFLREFGASHLQCYIGGWSAGHMHYQQSRSRKATLFRAWPGQKYKNCDVNIKKYKRMGFKFSRAEEEGPLTRSMKDSDSFSIDYGDLYRPFIRQSHRHLLDTWLSERRQNIDGISWTQFDGRIFSVQNVCKARYRQSHLTFASQNLDLPLDRIRRLGNLIAINIVRPDALRTEMYRSSVGPGSKSTRWQLRDLAKTGTVLNTLCDATPWSWVL